MVLNPNKVVIVKVERVLFPPGQPAKIYDQAKSCVLEIDLDDKIKEQLGGETIGYFQATPANHGRSWRLGIRVPNKGW